MTRPNFLIILSDQHHPRIMGCAGDPAVRTPNLDALAARGVRFDNAYCAAPLCVPSRMTLLTGRSPSDLHAWTNAFDLGSYVPTFAHSLSLAGYETVLCGRMHFNGPDQNHGFQRRLVGDVGVGMTPETDFAQLFEGQFAPATAGQSHRAMAAVGPGRTTYTAFDDDVTRRACAYLEERGQGDAAQPFAMVAGYLLPHNPYICPKVLFDEYMDKLPPLEISPQYWENLHPAVRHWRETRRVDTFTPEQTRRARAAYFGLVTYMDTRIGEVLQALEESGLAKNTIVVYLSDHGDMAGQHGMWWKDSFYEGSVGVPMIWSWPGQFRSAARVDSITSLLDVGPTCLELAAAEPLPFARGHSLRRFLQSEETVPDWPNATFAECYAAGERPARMVRSGEWKLNFYHGYEHPQLFHLPSDPEEVCDLGCSEQHAEIRRELQERLLDGWSGERVESVEARYRAGWEIVDQWNHSIKVGESELWSIPRGCNVFPERCVSIAGKSGDD